MAILVGIDETSGTQDANQGGATSNDVSGSLPVLFSTALSFETLAGSVNPVSATALSGATSSSSTGTQVISFGAAVQDVKFTDSSGAALSGLDSGIATVGGREIFLYTSSHDNNVLLGREATAGGLADASGVVAFALYLDTGTGSASDMGATGAKLWMAQFEALHQDSATGTPNDFVSLAQDLFVSVNTLQNFSLSGAPSGNNLFLMFGDGTPSTSDVTIIATGKNPADQSSGANVSTGDTVVTSQGGIGDTTIGTNNQMIDPGEGMYFTFVKGANPDYTIPNLSATEANVEANIDFTQAFFASSASFLVSQLQPPKGVTLKLTAVNDPTLGSGATYVNNLHNGDDTQVNIGTVMITRTVTVHKVPTTQTYTFTEASNAAQAGISVDFSGSTAKITGLVAGDRVSYVADGNHDRLLVDNVGNANANLNSSFDIGGFRLESGSLSTTDLGNVAFIDDAPTAAAALGAGSVTHDETAGNQSAAGANDTTAAGVIALFAGVTNTSTQLATAGYAQGSASAVDSSGGSFGADGQAASGATAYSLAVASTGVDSGLTTDDGTAILLYKEGDLVVGRIGSSAGAAAFAVAIDSSTGVLSMAQYSAVKHSDATNANDSTHVADTALQAVVTLTDGDGDQSTASVNIGSEVKILDDGPAAAAALGTGSVTHDETVGAQSASGANDTTDAAVIALFSGVTNKSTQLATSGYAQGSASVVDSSGGSFGSDGAAASGATTYSLAVSAAGVDSGLDTDAGTNILLFKEGSLVVGRIGSSSGAAAFAIAIDSTTGVLSMAQYSAVKHGDTTNPNDQVSVSDSALLAVVTVKDGDGDTNSASVNIGNEVKILDDGPTLAFGNVIGTGTVNAQYGTWSMAPGVDGLGTNGVDMAMTAFQLVKPDNTVVSGTSFAFSETAPSPDGSGNYHFTGSVTGDLDNNAGTPDITEHFTMTVFTNGTYNIDLQEGFMSTTTESTANGSLGAGGPDAVQTLTVGSDHIVFFSAVPTASASDLIALGTESGAADFTEAQLESAHPAVIDFTKAMNVSTSGIGDANNNLQGDATASIGAGDEAFVANPGTQFTSAKVFIDNSVQGYSYTGGERMYYRILYIDGTDSGQVLITQNLGLANKGQPTFLTIDGGGKAIDAIELTMATGVVKIPEIQFITQTNNLADGLKLSFTATVADGDGDTASSAFQANLSANALSGAFDFVLNGAASALDWFNVDLTQSATKYQVNGFDTGTTRDKLVLLGNAGATFSIDNTGADAVVTVNETGGQVDTITVVGVDLLNTDVTLI
jgi:hypothetical protein